MSSYNAFSKSELSTIAINQKRLLWTLLTTPLTFVPFLNIPVIVFIAFAVYRTTKSLRLPQTWLWATIPLLPLVNLFIVEGLLTSLIPLVVICDIIAINSDATKQLRTAGLRVGIMGIKQTDLLTLETKSSTSQLSTATVGESTNGQVKTPITMTDSDRYQCYSVRDLLKTPTASGQTSPQWRLLRTLVTICGCIVLLTTTLSIAAGFWIYSVGKQVLPYDETVTVTGKAGLNANDDSFDGTLYNGSKYLLEEVIVVVTAKESNGEERWSRQFKTGVFIEPLTVGGFGFKVLDTKGATLSWNIDLIKGSRNPVYIWFQTCGI